MTTKGTLGGHRGGCQAPLLHHREKKGGRDAENGPAPPDAA